MTIGHRRSHPSPRVARGFTLIELMVTVAITVVLLVLVARSFTEFREKAIVRGAAGDLMALVAQAKLEAAKRNDFVTVSVRGSGSAWCIGLQKGITGCDCTSTTLCDISQLSTGSFNGAKLDAAANFGGSPATDFSIDPRVGMLRNLSGGGSVLLRSPSDRWDYRVQFNLTATAQTNLCAPTGGSAGKHKLSDYPSC